MRGPHLKKKPLILADMPFCETEKIEIVRVGTMRQLRITGIKQIVHYAPDKMIFALKKEQVEITGHVLDCTTYTNGNIGITGYIKQIVFTGEKK